MTGGTTTPAGTLGMRLLRAGSPWPARELSVREIRHHGLPRAGLPEAVNAWRASNRRHLWRGARRVLTARSLKLPTLYGSLFLTLHRDGQPLELGLASMRVVTTTGVGFIVDGFQNLVELEAMKYHGIGTGTNAESSSDTALQTESTTALNPDSIRATGTTTEGASANVYRTVGTVTVDASVACTEHGIFSQAATGGGTLLDRSVFSVVNMASGDSMQFTYDLTINAGN